MWKKSRWAWLVALLAVFSIFAAACGDDDDSSSDDGSSDDSGDGDGASGTVEISGSSTVEPISSAVADLLAAQNDQIAVNVDGPGTGDGFALFCDGETDISDASRPIKDEEAATCEENGIDYIELEIGFDGLTVMTNPANDTITCLTKADLYALMGPESADVNNWSDAQALAEELGSTTTFPDLPMEISAPGEESGTYDAFIELALQSTVDERFEAGDIPASPDDPESPEASIRQYPGQSDDNVIIQGIEGADGSFGWVGFAFAEGAGEGVKEIEIDGGDGCVAPSAETIADASYPLSRSLYIYVNTAKAAENPAVAAYVDFYLNDGIEAVTDAGYVALPADRIQATRDAWEIGR